MILIGEKLKQLRQENGLRQEQVARLVGADRSSISAEDGDTIVLLNRIDVDSIEQSSITIGSKEKTVTLGLV